MADTNAGPPPPPPPPEAPPERQAAMMVAPTPNSPPKYPDLCGKRRLQLEVQILNREIGFLEEDLQFLEGMQPVSRFCKDVIEFIGAKADPLIPINKRRSKCCYLWNWLRSKLCSWICCCFDGCLIEGDRTSCICHPTCSICPCCRCSCSTPCERSCSNCLCSCCCKSCERSCSSFFGIPCCKSCCSCSAPCGSSCCSCLKIPCGKSCCGCSRVACCTSSCCCLDENCVQPCTSCCPCFKSCYDCSGVCSQQMCCGNYCKCCNASCCVPLGCKSASCSQPWHCSSNHSCFRCCSIKGWCCGWKPSCAKFSCTDCTGSGVLPSLSCSESSCGCTWSCPQLCACCRCSRPCCVSECIW